MLISFIVLELCPGQSSKSTNKQRAIIQAIGKAELRFLCTAHLLNEIYLPTKFHVVPLIVLELWLSQSVKINKGQY
jgi:hypothetical protein